MKIIENSDEAEDFAGRFPVCAIKGPELAKVVDWLYREFVGYKFAIVLDVSHDDYPVPEDPKDFTADVLFLDTVFEEAAVYIGLDEAQRMLDKLKGVKR